MISHLFIEMSVSLSIINEMYMESAILIDVYLLMSQQSL